jgi:hypothetical protein
MTHKPIGLGASASIVSTTATKSSAFLVQSNVLRIVAVSAGTFVAIGTEPTASASDYYIAADTEATLALNPASQRVVGVTTGTTTVIDFPEGTGSPFEIGDYVSFTSNNQSYYNFTHQPVISVNTTSGIGGYFSTRVSISTNTSGIKTAFNGDGDLRKSLKISNYGTGSGVLYYQQVQITGQA